MQIEVSECAKSQLAKQIKAADHVVKLAYDIEGCGCAVDGVVQLWKLSEDDLLPEDRVAYNDGAAKLVYDHRQEVFFEDVIRLDYHEDNHVYSLKSNNQIYNSMLQILNKTGDE